MTPSLSLRALLPALVFLMLAACGGDKPSAPSAPEAPQEAPGPVEEAAAPEGKIDIEATKASARTAMFVPAPTEFQAALKASKVDVDLAALVKGGDRGLQGKSRSIIALETGVRIANTLLMASGGDNAATMSRMKSAREGLVALAVPTAVVAEVDRVIADFSAGSLTAGELSPALDILAERIHDELGRANDANCATLVQAGGWVQGAHLLATGLAAKGQGGDAAALLRQPTVLMFFMDFLNKMGAGDPAVDAVLTEMEKLKNLSQKPKLESSDMATIAATTGAILAKF